MVIADVYYAQPFQKFLQDNHLSHPDYAWSVNFRRMAEVAFTAEDSLSRGTLRVDGKKVTVKSADAQWVKDVEKSLTISFVDKDSTYHHVIELVTILDRHDASSRHAIFRRLITVFRGSYEGADNIPRPLDDNVEDIFADGIESIVSHRIDSRVSTIEFLENQVSMVTASSLEMARRHAATIETMTTENAATVTSLEARMKTLRAEVNALEKKLLLATRVHRDRTRLSGWFVYQLPTQTVDIAGIIFRGGQLTAAEVSHFMGDDMYYVTNDADVRFDEYYVSMLPLPPFPTASRETYVTVPLRRREMGEGVIIRLSDTSYMMTHAPKLMMKAAEKIDP